MKKGLFICFIGTDGSGKTTIARNFEKSLKNSGKSCNYIWCGWRGFESLVFKPIVNFLKLFYKQKYTSDPKSNADVLGYFALIDYILRVLPAVTLSLYRYNYIIADRYIYDVIVGFSAFSKRNSKTNLFRNFFWIFPKPDITFFIDIPEYIAYSRKNDIPSIEYLTKQRVMYHKFLKQYEIQRIDGTKNFEEILIIIKQEVTNWAAN